ncbi:MAG: type II toxin-antitoxin system VapB family antitoxin [Jatrophihabitans sp.]|uniref:type II toxin-antitoxin system VapB family antitoxin n=1 Tax=Jatrophihabitans sp. TaxID=1932789 RepID=UPI003F80767C
MADIVIRDVPPDLLAAVDARAFRLGLSRSQYVCQLLARDLANDVVEVTDDDLRQFGERFTDLGDDDLMATAWR